MKYIVFDLDATLGNMNASYFLLRTLRPRNFWKERQAEVNIQPNPVESQLETIYRQFVQEIARRERSANPIGIVRPGIFRVFEAIEKMDIGGIIIYSNNGDINLGEFIRDILRAGLNNPTIINDCVTWYNPCRQATEIQQTKHLLDKSDEDAYPWPGGRSPKTWATVKELLETGSIKATNVSPTDVVFIDDNFYPDMKTHLHDNYLKVSRYNYKCPLEDIITILTQLFDVKDWANYSMLLNECISGSLIHSLVDLLEYIKTNTRQTHQLPVPAEDVEPMLEFFQKYMN
jgi:hypothetical protein